MNRANGSHIFIAIFFNGLKTVVTICTEAMLLQLFYLHYLFSAVP
jgi:hypothetical protein